MKGKEEHVCVWVWSSVPVCVCVKNVKQLSLLPNFPSMIAERIITGNSLIEKGNGRLT